jgi:hypothetical protein
MTTTMTGPLCWRDSQLPESQLASLYLTLHRVGLAPAMGRISVFTWQEDNPIDAIPQNAVTAAIERYFW